MSPLTGLAGAAEDETLRGALEALGSRNGTRLQALALSLEMRDPYTAAHQRRVSRLAGAMAAEIGLSEQESQGIALAGAIHDIGKSFVPASILNKPDKLNEFEQYVVRGHPRAGYTVLKPVESPWPIARVVLEHHERLNGSGYPFGLREDALLRQSHIVAAADVMESMISERPYRRALQVVDALEHLTNFRGILYHPEAVDACIWLFSVKGWTLPDGGY